MDMESKMTVRKILMPCGASMLALAATLPAHARTDFSPYLEVGQVLTADLKNGGDTLTYSTVAVGIDTTVDTTRAQGQVNYRYERRFGWGKNGNDDQVHSGLARVAYQIVPRALSFEAGGIATRTRSDIRGGIPGVQIDTGDNITQVYSAFAGPSLQTQFGDLNVAAAYRFGYTKVEDKSAFFAAPGQPVLDSYDDSLNHNVTASVGMEPGLLPFGWKVSGGYEQENAGQLDQRFENMHGRGDVTLPVTPTVALLGGVGYEDIQSSQRAALLDAGGEPVFDGNGRFVPDPSGARQLSYSVDGIYWDVGVAWRPNQRTALEARVGRRYGSMTYTGSLSHQLNDESQVQLGIYDEVQTFGQQLGDNLSRLPTSFAQNTNPLSPQFGGCVFGGSGGAGGCLNPALQAVSNSVYRSRGATMLFSTKRGPWNGGFGLGYSRRDYKAPASGTVVVNGTHDQSWFGQGDFGYVIDSQSVINGSVYASLYQSGILGAPDVLTTGATTSYQRHFGSRLTATAAVGMFSNKVDGSEADLNAAAQLSMRVQF